VEVGSTYPDDSCTSEVNNSRGHHDKQDHLVHPNSYSTTDPYDSFWERREQMTEITMLVPYRKSKSREKIWNFLKPEWQGLLEGHGLKEIIEQDSGTELWNKSIAIARGVLRINTEYTAIVDADVWVNDLDKAFDYIRECPVPYLIAHRRLLRLNELYTSWLLRGEFPFSTLKSPISNLHLDEKYQKAMPGGGCVIVRTSTLRRFVCFDPRHSSWGNEDRDWWFAMKTLVGPPVQLGFDMHHLYHPKQARVSREFGSAVDEALHKLYKAAYDNEPEMFRLIREAQAAVRAVIPEW